MSLIVVERPDTRDTRSNRALLRARRGAPLIGSPSKTSSEKKLAAKSASPGVHIFKTMVEGVKRCYFVLIPPNYEDATKWSVVVVFHGGGGTARSAMRETGWDKKAGKEGFLAVFPEATLPDPARPPHFIDNPRIWNSGAKLSMVGAAQIEAADVKFVAMMLDELKVRFRVNEHRIYATGFSNGASMVFRVARELSPIFAAAAPVAGVDWADDRNPERPVPLMYIVGACDPMNPINGREVRVGEKPLGSRPLIREMIGKWVKMLGCPEEGRVVYDQDGATGVAYGVPGETADVTLYIIEGHGHHWPGGRSALPVTFAGENTATLNATDVIWAFFKEHSKGETNHA